MNTLNPRQLEIMQILWEHGVQKPSEIQEKLSEPIKNSALRWQLTEMVSQGHILRKKNGKAFYYEAKTPRKKIMKAVAGRLAQVFCGGSTLAFLGQLIESQNLSEEDFAELEKIALGGSGESAQDDKEE